MAIIPSPDDSAFIVDSVEPFYPAQINRSAWTSRSKSVGLPGAAMWYASAHIRNPNTHNKRRVWRAFRMALRGQQNKFRLPVTRCPQRYGPNPTVKVSGNANTITLQGFPANATNLVAGEYMTVPLPSGHERLVIITQPVVSNAAGEAVATFEPDLGEAPAIGATVETKKPWLLAKQANARAGWAQQNGIDSQSFELEEAL